MEGIRLEEDDVVTRAAAYMGPPSPPSRNRPPPLRPARFAAGAADGGWKGKEKSEEGDFAGYSYVVKYDREESYDIRTTESSAQSRGYAKNRELVLGFKARDNTTDDREWDATLKSLPTLHQLILKQDVDGTRALLGRLPPSSLAFVLAEKIAATGATPLHIAALLPPPPSAGEDEVSSSADSSPTMNPYGASMQDLGQAGDQQPRDVIADVLLSVAFQSPQGLDQLLFSACQDHAGPKARATRQHDEDQTGVATTGETVLHIAARNGFDGFIRKVFEHIFALRRASAISPRGGGHEGQGVAVDWDSFVNCPNDKGQTPLHVAAKAGQFDCCMTLIANGAAVDWEDLEHRTAYDLALQRRHDEVVRLLRSEGATIPRLYNDPQPLTEEERANLVVDDYGWIMNGDPERGPTPRNISSSSSSSRASRRASGGSSRRRAGSVSATTTTTTTTTAAAPVITRLSEKQRRLDAKRTKKWEKMLRDWGEHEKDKDKHKKKWKKVQKRARKGIPPQVRGQAWIKLTGAHETIARPPIKYDPRRVGSRFLKQIDLDIARTHRDHLLFKVRYSDKQCQLFRLLRAYSLHNKAVGYTQGMSSIAAMLLTFIDTEEEAFWVFDSLMRDYGMTELYRPGFPGLKKDFFIHEQLLSRFLPRLHAHFEDQCIISSAYATKWFLMIFMNLPYGTTVRLWDYVFCEGYRAIFFVGISLLHELEDELLRRDMEGIFLLLGNELSYRQLDTDRIIRGAVRLRRKAKKGNYRLFQQLDQEYARDQ